MSWLGKIIAAFLVITVPWGIFYLVGHGYSLLADHYCKRHPEKNIDFSSGFFFKIYCILATITTIIIIKIVFTGIDATFGVNLWQMFINMGGE